jgi:hypothetical protein
LEDVQARYKDRVKFLLVYTREAHPVDGWRKEDNNQAGILIRQPHTNAERNAVAKQCSLAMKITIPVVVDEINDRVAHTYSGMPERLYVIDQQGRIAYKGGRGPKGFKPNEMETALVMVLLDQALASGK